MKTMKRISAAFLVLALVLSMLPAVAFAAGSDYSTRLLVEKTDTDTVDVKWMVQTSNGAVLKTTNSIIFKYDNTQYDMLTNDGTVITTKTMSDNLFSDYLDESYNQNVTTLDTPALWGNSGIYTEAKGNWTFVLINLATGNATASKQYTTETALAVVHLKLKSGTVDEGLPGGSIALATKDEANGCSQSGIVIFIGAGEEQFIYGNTSSATDTLLTTPVVAAGTGVTFAKPAYSGAAATVTKVEKSGSNVVVTATVPSGETAQYGYSNENDASKVTNWQDSNSFAEPTTPGTYYFFARVAENASHKAGGESAGTAYTVNGPLSLSYTAPASMTYGTAIADMSPTVSGGSGTYTYSVDAGSLPNGLNLNASSGVISGTPGAVAAAADVTIKVTDSDSDTQTYTITFPAVAKQANTMTSVTQANVEYGTEVNPSATSNGTAPTFEYKARGAGDDTYTSTKPTTVGEYTVKASSTGHATVADAVVTTDFAITQKTLTNLGFTGVTVTKVYDGTTSAGAVGGSDITFTGKVGTDVVSIKAVAGEYTDANAGTGKTVTLTLSLDGAAKDNYKLASYTQDIDTAAITVADYTYTVAATQTFRTGSGLSAITVAPATGTGVNSESVTGTLGWYTDNGYSTPATDAALSSLAADASVTLYWKFTATDTNYTTTSKTGSTVFTAKNKDDLSTSIDVSGITGLAKTYDGEAASYTGSATVTGHTSLDSSLVYEWYKADNTKLAEAPKNVGSYYLKVSIPDANPDYIGSAKVDFTISKREVTVAAGTYKVSKTYDGTVNVGSATVTGALSVTGILPADSDVTVQATPVAYTSNGVGVQSSMNVNIALNGTGSENYKIKDDATTVTIPCEITAKAITIASATATNRDYAEGNVSVETDVTFTGTIGTLTKGSDYTVTGTMDNANAGSGKTVNVTVTLTNDNYSLAANTTTTTVTINKIAYAGSTSTTGSAKYGATGSVELSSYLKDGYVIGTITKTNEGIFDGEPTMDGTKLKFTFANDPGNADQTADITVPVTSATNYDTYSIEVTVTVNAKTVPTVTAPTAKTGLTYNGAAQALINTGTTTGGTIQYKVGSGTYSTAIPTATNADTYTVYYKVVGDSEYADVAESSVSVTIAKKDVTVAPKSFTITKGGAIPTFELVYTGLVGSDILTPSATPDFTCYETGTTPVSTTTAAGTYAITWTNESATTFTGADNYNVAKTATGTLTINNPAPSGGGGGSYTPTYSVTVDKAENGSVTVNPKSASKGTTVTVTVKPDEGYELDTLTVTDKDGKAVTVTEKDGKYTFTMPASKVTVKAAFVEIEKPVVNPFVDVKEGDYFYDAVLWAVGEGITAGTSATTFSPDAGCTRAQIVTFLWRAAGSPAPKSAVSFADVSADSYYAKAVAWAVENGITGGTGDGKFSPDATCTREQAVTFLYRASGSPAVSGGSAFSDVAENAYYANAVAWAEKNEITGGIGGGRFGSGNNCTRGQIVTFLYRFMVK